MGAGVTCTATMTGRRAMTVSDAVRAVGAHFGLVEQACLIQRFGVEGAPREPEEFVKFAEACLLYDVPPSASWIAGLPAEWGKLC